ncbi:MAG: hypothetical protein GY778_02795 [bacterium]|nr:hypothetical protein [bacterium]
MSPASFPPIQFAFTVPAYGADGGLLNNLDCRFVQKRDGRVVGGNDVRVDPEFVDLDSGNTLSNPGSKQRAFNPFAIATFPFPDFSDMFSDEETPVVAVVVEANVSGPVAIDEVRGACDAKNRQPCDKDDHTLCLAGNGTRFQVEARWNNGTQNGDAGVFRNGFDNGEFYFFSPNNWNVLVHVLNGCKRNGHWWVFYAATTNVGFTLTVTDTQAGETKQYTNPLGQAAPAITDTAAFATCP